VAKAVKIDRVKISLIESRDNSTKEKKGEELKKKEE